MASIVLVADALRSLNNGALSGAYASLGTAFGHSMRIIKLTNNTDGDLIISFGNDIDNEFLPAASFLLLDIATNHKLPDGALYFEQGTIVKVKESTATSTGDVYLSCYYARGQ